MNTQVGDIGVGFRFGPRRLVDDVLYSYVVHANLLDDIRPGDFFADPKLLDIRILNSVPVEFRLAVGAMWIVQYCFLLPFINC